MPARRRTGINAIYETDLPPFLEAFGFSRGLTDAELLCHVCDSPVRVDTLYGFVAVSQGVVRAICTNPQCIAAAFEIGRTASTPNEKPKQE